MFVVNKDVPKHWRFFRTYLQASYSLFECGRRMVCRYGKRVCTVVDLTQNTLASILRSFHKFIHTGCQVQLGELKRSVEIIWLAKRLGPTEVVGSWIWFVTVFLTINIPPNMSRNLSRWCIQPIMPLRRRSLLLGVGRAFFSSCLSLRLNVTLTSIEHLLNKNALFVYQCTRCLEKSLTGPGVETGIFW